MLKNADVEIVWTLSTVDYHFGDRQIVFLDETGSDLDRESSSYHNESAYILYTSGTTGLPKAVEVTRKGLMNFIESVPKIIPFQPGQIIASFTSSTFDIFFLEAIMPLFLGLTVILSNDEQQRNPSKVIQMLTQYNIDILQMTPSHLRLLHLLDKSFTCLKNVQTLMVGGEVFPADLLSKLQSYANLKIYNMYGPTETTIWSTISDLTKKDNVDIGTPIENTRVYLLNEQMQKSYTEGEICIAGHGLAKGYKNNPVQTDKQFVFLPFEPFERVYKTGDIAKHDKNGNLIYIGRKDTQIKLHGHRIELEEIENILQTIKNIKMAVVCFDYESESLIAFYMAESLYNESDLLYELSKRLPLYMVPKKYVLVNQFCYTSNGKIDRHSLLEQFKNEKSEAAIPENFVETDSIEITIIKLIADILKIKPVKFDFSLTPEQIGLDSISYINLIVKLEDEFNIEFADEVLSISDMKSLYHIVEMVKKN